MTPPAPRRLVLEVSLGLAAAFGAALVALACADDPHRRTSSAVAAGGGGACEATPGKLPEPDCDNSDKLCTSTPGCVIDEARCGSKTTCLPIGDNKGKDVLDFRIRRLNIATPAALASDFIQSTVVTLNIDLAEKSCGELGKGLFSWLLRVDKAASTLVTGGAPPPSDPLGTGFCFASFDVRGSRVEPVTTKIEWSGDTFRSLEKRSVRIPIFLSSDVASVIFLPITDLVIDRVKVSDDGNCIGHMSEIALDTNCVEDKTLCSKWTTSGSLGGFITLEEADAVLVRDLGNKSLCSVLAGEASTSCSRDSAGAVAFKGDFCSKEKAPGGCGDSVWLAATFAASAAKIFDGRGNVDACSGVTETSRDAGADADASSN